MRTWFVTLVLFALTASEAGAACAGKITGVSAQAALTYSPFAAWNATQKLVLSVRNTGNVACAFQISIPASFYPLMFGQKLSFEIKGQITLAGGSGPFTAVTPSIKPSESAALPINVIVIRGQAVTSGTFLTRVGFTLTAVNAQAGGPALDQAVTPLSCTVPPVFEINVGGSGRNTTIQFGEIANNKTVSVVFHTRTTDHHILELHSQNSGHLVLQNASRPGSSIPYSLTIDGEPVSLSGAATLKYTTRPGEATRRLTVTLGDPAGVTAGSYSDIITVHIASLL